MLLARLFIAFFLLLSAAAGAEACERRFGFLENSLQKANTDLDMPSLFPKKISQRKIRKFNDDLKQEMDRMGIAAVPSKDVPAIFNYHHNPRVNESRIPRDSIKTFEVESVGATNKPNSMNTLAWEHPEMAEKLAGLRARGYKLILDPSLSLNSGGGAGAFFSPGTKSLTIPHNSPWSVFLHEFEHLEFDHQITEKMKELGFFREYEEFASKKYSIFEITQAHKKAQSLYEEAFGEYMNYLGELPGFQAADGSLSAKAVELYRAFPTELGVNESLATQRTLDQFAKEGFTLLDLPMLHERMYQIEHQLRSLESVRRSAAQEKLYNELKGAYQALHASYRGMQKLPMHRKALEFIGKYGWPGVGLMAYLAYNKEKGKEELVVTDGKKTLKVEMP